MPVEKRLLTCAMLRQDLLHSFFNDMQTDRTDVGLELEIIPFRAHDGVLNGLVGLHGPDGVIEAVRGVCNRDPRWAYAPLDDGTARFKHEGGAQITFEPGAQIEYSSSPHPRLLDAVNAMTEFLQVLNATLADAGIWLYHGGLNPWHKIDEVGLQMNKARYIHMNNFFEARGPYGQKMMRLSTSLQVNLDVGTEEVAHRRWLVANLMAPIMTAAFANSPFCEGKATGAKSFRSIIWQNLDPTRTGFQRGLEAADYQPCPVEQYLEFALDAFCLFLPDEHGDMTFDGHFRTFRHWMECGFRGTFPDMGDWVKHLSTLFPEVRPRGFYEIRYLDALCASYWMIPGIVLTHVLYDESAREQVIERLLPYRTTLTGMLREAATSGLSDPELATLAKDVFAAALKVASSKEDERLVGLFEHYMRELTLKGRCPADELMELNSGRLFTPQQYRDYESRKADEINASLASLRG